MGSIGITYENCTIYILIKTDLVLDNDLMRTLPLVALIATAAVIAFTSCGHKLIKTDPAVLNERMLRVQNIIPPNSIHLELVHFDLNSAKLTDAAKRSLKLNAIFLENAPRIHIKAEGYCDNRGSNLYNLELGRRRAVTVKAYLQTLGIAGDRISAQSFGKTHPLNLSDNEAAWAENRRASFRVQSEVPKMASQ